VVAFQTGWNQGRSATGTGASSPGDVLSAGPGDFVLLPARLPHTFIVGADEPLRTLQITTPSGFEQFAAEAGEPAGSRRLPDPAPVDPVALGHAAARYAIELLGPPPLT